MADPLTALVDKEAPARTNFFSPPSGQGTLARYGNSRVGLAESEGLAKATGDLTRDRIDRTREQRFNRQADFEERQFEQRTKMDEAQLKREQLLADADELEAGERKLAQASRGGFLREFALLDPKDPDVDLKTNELIAGTPPGLIENDEAIKAILRNLEKGSDDARALRNAEAARKQTFENKLKVIESTRVFQLGESGASQEDYRAALTPEGDLDDFVAGSIRGRAQAMREMGVFKDKQGVYQANREKMAQISQENREKTVKARDEEWRAREQEKNKEYDRRQGEDDKTWAARTAVLQENRKEMAGIQQVNRKALLDARALTPDSAKRQNAVKQVLQDTAAFPKHLTSLEAHAKANFDKSPALLKVQHPDLVAAAEEWDKNQLFKELDAAYDMESAEDYVNLVPGLSEG
jgi:hypothetical protein